MSITSPGAMPRAIPPAALVRMVTGDPSSAATRTGAVTAAASCPS